LPHDERAAHHRRRQGFLDANPAVQWIDAFVFDMSGISRGKRIRRPDLLAAPRTGS
jgi:glutamine synthetase